ncbi:MAG: amidohydrolase [Gemmatales bacterium]|nr:MAG: amidohydrolase [Gemmatales bacterium]
MGKLTRRECLQSGGLAVAASLSSPLFAFAKSGAQGEAPDLIVVNGRVYTVDDTLPKAEAFAVKHGRFVAVGSSKHIRSLAGNKTEIIDADGMTVTPGFIDAHTHPASAGVSELRKVNCDLRSIAEIKKAIAERVKKTPKGRWVKGFKYDDTKLREGRPLSRKDLDEVAKEHPVEILHRGGHTAIYNTFAFKAAGISKETPDPPGGQFGRDKNGELTGFVAEKARQVFAKIAPEPEITRRDRRQGVVVVSKLMSAAGLTSVHDAHTSEDFFVAYQDAREAGELYFRVYAMVSTELFASLKKARLRTGFGDDWLRIGGLKLFADGSCNERTMRMSTPYADRPNYFGILTMSQKELNETIEDAHWHQFQVGVHANGDVAIDMVLKAYERALKIRPHPDPRFRIEHCTLVNPGLLKRIAALGVIPTPFYTYVHFHGNKWAAYGKEKLQWMFAHRSFLDYKIRVAGASDYVPGPFEPLMAIQSMVTRKDFEGRVWGPKQKITVGEALRICTLHGAYASFEEKSKGSITPGKLADFVILAKDPHEVEPDRIKEIAVMRTVIGGKTVHSQMK